MHPHRRAGEEATLPKKREAEASLTNRERRSYFALSSSFDLQVPVLSTGGATCAPSESPARQSGLLGSSVMSVALPAPVVALSTSPPPLRCEDPELLGAPELS